VLFLALYGLAAWIFPHLRMHRSFNPPKQGVTIYILSNGVHTDFIVPVKNSLFNWSEEISFSDVEEADSSYQWMAVGWGDKGFYIDTPTWADLKASTAFNAAFGLGTTALHISFRRRPPAEGDLCLKLVISEAQYRLLVKYIRDSFRKKGDPELINHPGYSRQDCFYEACGSYSMFRTCNVWTGNGLRYIGAPIGSWTPFHRAVLDHCRE
jgi:uncharacterized protein (TIGR02117 family)